MDAVRAVEDALAPGAQKIALGVEHRHRVLAAVERIDPVLSVDADCRDIAQDDLVRQLCPGITHDKSIFTAAKLNRHAPRSQSKSFLKRS